MNNRLLEEDFPGASDQQTFSSVAVPSAENSSSTEDTNSLQ